MTIKHNIGHVVGLIIVSCLVAIGIMSSAIQVAHGQSVAAAGSQSQSGSTSGAASGSTAGSAAIINFETGPGTITNRVEGGTNNRLTYAYEGTARSKISTVPDVYAPSLAGGNPCQASASGGGSVLGFGVSAGYAWSDEDCSVRQEVALLGNMAKLQGTSMAMAYRHFCLHSDRVRETLAAEGVIDCTVAPVKAQVAALCADGRPPSPSGYCPGDDLSAKGKDRKADVYAAAGIPAAPAAQPVIARVDATVAQCDRIVDGKWCFVD